MHSFRNFKHNIGIQLDDCDTPVDAIDHARVARFVSGSEPWSRAGKLSRVRKDASFLPDGHSAERLAHGADRKALLVRGDGWTLHVVHWKDQTAYVAVTSVNEEIGQPIFELVTSGVTEELEPEARDVPLGFWHLGRYGPTLRERKIAIEPWQAVRHNYNHHASSLFDSLLAVTPASLPGRLLLLHGPPGTGKTTALRSLAHEWRSWCRFEYVIDPERLFSQAGYLMELLLGDEDGKSKWRLIVLEDCDELIRSNAKDGTGQALSRLLNLTDGLLGQGLDVLVAISTNEPLARLHPAVTRAGRCLAEIEVGPLSRHEAQQWLGGAAHVEQGATLAQLYAMKNANAINPPERELATGQYL